MISCANPTCTNYNRATRLEKGLEWTPEAPDHWRCRTCNTVFPSADYPEDRTESFHGLGFEYHLDPSGNRHYFTPVARWAKCYHALQTARRLGRAAAQGDTVAAPRLGPRRPPQISPERS